MTNRLSELNGYLARGIYALPTDLGVQVIESLLDRPATPTDIDDLITACEKPGLDA